MPVPSIRGDILEIAKVLRAFAATASDAEWRRLAPPGPLGADARGYFAAARRLGRDSGSDDRLDASFRPFFLVNGLLQASILKRHADRAFTLEVLAAGLVEFADYFQAIHPDRLAPQETAEEFARLAAEQTRYFAYCAAQLPECGMDMEGVWMTMKGDSLDMKTSFAIRAIIEDGPGRIAAASFYSDEEKRLWAETYARRPGAYEELQKLLVSSRRVPFRKSPTA